MGDNSVWNKFQEKFPEIIANNSKYNNIINNILTSPNNILLYCSNGFPIDLFIEVILLKKTNNNIFYRAYHIWEKSINYCENQYFIEIDLMNPENIKNLDKLTTFLLNIVNTKNIGLTKHIVILKHIDLLAKYFYEFRILLEKFSNNIIFISCTHNISKIEAPIKSRYNIQRVPLFTLEEIDDIYKNYLDMSINDIFYTLKSRDIIKSLFITEHEEKPSTKEIITEDFIIYNYPPIVDFLKTFNKNNINDIRNLSYKLCQYNIKIIDIINDFINLTNSDIYLYYKYPKIAKKNINSTKNLLKIEIVKIGVEVEYMLAQTNKCREPIYIENLLCQLLI